MNNKIVETRNVETKQSSIDVAWWDYEGDKVASSIFAVLKNWDQTSNRGLQYQNMLHYRMYSGRNLETLSMANFVVHNYASEFERSVFYNRSSGLTLNVVASTIETLTSKLGKNQIKPTAITQGSIYEQRQRTKGFNKAAYGVLREGGAYRAAPLALKNALIFGTGEIHPYVCHDTKKIKFENVFPDEIMVDPGEGYYGNPRMKYRRKFVSRRALQEIYPDLADRIRAVQGINMGTYGVQYQDMVLCVEAWRLARNGSNGRHVLCLDGIVLEDDPEWSYSEFPHAVMRYETLPTGYWGQGVAEKLRGIQSEINFTIQRIREALKRVAKPWIFMEMGSKINPKTIDNEIGSIVPFQGTPPIIQMAQAVSPEQYRHLQDLYGKAFEIVGVSQLSAQSRKPSGLDSGVAIREAQDIETERFAMLARQYEDFYVDLMHATSMLIENELGDDYEISTHSKDNGLEKLRWGDIKLPPDAYIWQVWPQSSLPQKPEARLERVIELMQGGLIDPQMGLELLDFPDLESHMKIILAPARLIFQMLEEMIFEDAEYMMPEPFMDLEKCVQIGQGYYNWAMLKKFPDDKLELIRNFINDAQNTIKEAQMAEMEQQMGMQLGQQSVGLEAPAQQAIEAQLGAPVGQQVMPENLAPNVV